MNRSFLVLLYLLGLSFVGNSQCPELSINTTVTNCSGSCVACPGDSFTFSISDNNLPDNGTIDWYISPTPGFVPPGQGTLLSSSAINGNNGEGNICPNIEAVYIDACIGSGGGEGDNEFLVVSSGSGFYVSNFQLDYDINNNGGSAGNGDVNLGGNCTWQTGNAALYTGCANIFAAGPGDFIPPNSLVIFQSSSMAGTTYNISSMCGLSDCIYIVSSSCDRNQGAYSNCDVNAPRNVIINILGTGCTDMVTHDGSNPNCFNSDGMYMLGDEVTYGNNGCNNGPTLNYVPISTNSSVDDFILTFSNAECGQTLYVKGILNSTEVNTTCCDMMDFITPEYEFLVSCPTADVTTTNGNLCPGECVDVFMNLAGGSTPYSLDLTLAVSIINFSFTVPGFDVNDKITICYGGSGIFPTFDSGTNTLTVPDIVAGFSGSLTLDSFQDANGCAGAIAGNSVAISFLEGTDAFTAIMEECEVSGGNAFFDLTQLNSTVNGGTAFTVDYFTDMNAMNPILTPNAYPSMTATIYAIVNGMPCPSDIVPVDLIVVTNGDAGMVFISCGPNIGNTCTICDSDITLGENIDLNIFFPDNQNYEVVIDFVGANNSNSSTLNLTGPLSTQSFFIDETTTFTLSQVTLMGDCPDMTDLGPPVQITLAVEPEITGPGNLSDCGSITLPPITGNNLSGNEAYYTQSGGMGTMYLPGEVFTGDITLYIYDGIMDCFDEEEIDLNIATNIVYDDPVDVTACGVYTLPAITGMNVGSTAAYFTQPGGMGSAFVPGDIVGSNTTLYISDPFATCSSNEPDFSITIEQGPVFSGVMDTVVCDTFIVEIITGTDLSGNEAYYNLPNGMGSIIFPGDTILSDTTLYLFDSNGSCDVQDSIHVSIVGLGFPGIDTTHTFCVGTNDILNLMTLSGNPDTLGIWSEVSSSNLDISDSTMVDISGLSAGSYFLKYEMSSLDCGDTISVLTLIITDEVNAGDDNFENLCDDQTTPIDLFSYLGVYSSGGVWKDLDMSGVDLMDPTAVSFEGFDVGVYNYQYTIANSPSCDGDSSVLTINISEAVNAGINQEITVCEGSLVDLATILVDNTGVGVFRDLDMSGALSGSVINTAGLNGIYNFSHLIMAMGACADDEAFFELEVASAVSAGDDSDEEICMPGIVNLSDYINGDAGGLFLDALTNDTIINGLLDVSGGPMSQTFMSWYIVGDGNSCPFDTSSITLTLISPPSVSVAVPGPLCVGACGTVSLNYTVTQDYNAFITVMDELGEQVGVVFLLEPGGQVDFQTCNDNDGIFEYFNLEPNHTYTFTVDSLIPVVNPMDGCTFYSGNNAWFPTEDALGSTLDTTICSNESIIIEGEVFDINNPSGDVLISGGDCDTILQVNLSFNDPGTSVFDPTLCTGTTIEIGGIVFHEASATGSVTLFGASANGCDSIVAVNIQFADNSEIDVNDAICPGDTVYVNGNPYYLGNSVGTEIVTNPNPDICDTTFLIDLALLNPGSMMMDDLVCDPAASFIINGNVYDVNNPQGTEMIMGGAANGCDSIIEIDLNFQMESSFDIINTSCDMTYSIEVNGMTYDINNPQGVELISGGAASGCDSTININLSFGELSVDFMVTQPECPEDNEGILIIEDVQGTAPYFYEESGVLIEIVQFPFEIPYESGVYMLPISDSDGCMMDINYSIMAPAPNDVNVTQTDLGINETQLIINSDIIPDAIEWSPSTGLSCNDCPDPISTVEVTTPYAVYLTYGNCMDTLLTTVVREISNTITLPNIFSPNSDGMNESFYVQTIDPSLSIARMFIYDRWGNVMFSAANIAPNDPSLGWNGKSEKGGGQFAVPGVYVYFIELVNALGESDILTGDITLVR